MPSLESRNSSQNRPESWRLLVHLVGIFLLLDTIRMILLVRICLLQPWNRLVYYVIFTDSHLVTRNFVNWFIKWNIVRWPITTHSQIVSLIGVRNVQTPNWDHRLRTRNWSPTATLFGICSTTVRVLSFNGSPTVNKFVSMIMYWLLYVPELYRIE